MKLEGKTALVTGANGGIGRAIAVRFAREGADVVVHYYGEQASAEQTAREVEAQGRRAVVLPADFGDPRAAQQLWAEALAQVGHVDILVNNAGTGAGVKVSTDTPLDTFIRVLNIDLVSPWALCQAAALHMVERGGGVIVNITSVHEEIPKPGGAAYDAAKGGLRNITRTLALELAPMGVRVNNIAPGMIATPMTADRVNDPAKLAEASSHIPLRRPGQPDEVASVALFLASDDASYVTGSSYFVDGGLTQNAGGA